MANNHLLKRAIGLHPEVIIPYGNYLTIKLIEADDTSLGGILLPDQVRDQDRQCLARVVKVGTGQRSITTAGWLPCLTEPGDLIIILKHSPVELKLGGEVFHVVFEGDVIGKIDEAALEALMAEPERLTPVELDEVPENAIPVEKVEQHDGFTIAETAGGILVARSER